MNDLLIPLNLSEFPYVDSDESKDEVIRITKYINQVFKLGREKTKGDKCYFCGRPCDSFCNSHTVPAFCLRKIARNGEVAYLNSILGLPVRKKLLGVNEAGTFHLICRKCDSQIFQDYENPDHYANTPTIKMLAQIDMKSNLKNIEKRLIEIELYKELSNKIPDLRPYFSSKVWLSKQDLEEYKASYRYAYHRLQKPFQGDYYISYYQKLPYIVPIAFQGTIAMVSDMEGNTINNLYNTNARYHVKSVMLCIFPLKEETLVMMFVARKNDRYKRFFRQLNKAGSLADQLCIINYLLFAYSEDYFLSPDIPEDALNQLIELSGKTGELINLTGKPATCGGLEIGKKIYDLGERNRFPNLLLKEFALQNP